MSFEVAVTVQCPFCGEDFVTFVDTSVAAQNYIEDCQVCCRPIDLSFWSRAGKVLRATASRS